MDDIVYCARKADEAELLKNGYERLEPQLKAVGLGKVRIAWDHAKKDAKEMLVSEMCVTATHGLKGRRREKKSEHPPPVPETESIQQVLR